MAETLAIWDLRRVAADAAAPVAVARLERLRQRAAGELRRAQIAVAPILAAVRRRGDRGLEQWCRRLEGPKSGPAPYRVPQTELAAAWRQVPADLRRALLHARRNLRTMAAWQMPRAWMRTIEPGVRVGQVVRPLESVGCYVPGGRYPLASSLLMAAVPARAAGVARLVAVCPRPSDAVLAAAYAAGVDEFYAMGGAQAIAALGWGTPSLAPVAKIVGPGGIYVTAAKRLVAAETGCGVDFDAGPTEVLLVADADADPAALAADLIAQAEHDPRAGAWLATDSAALARAVPAEAARQLRRAPNPTAAAALRRRGAILLTASLAQAMELANRLAPEHITVPRSRLAQVRSAGSIFVGAWAPQAVGDYLTGANHVLPTAGGARLRGGLSVLDFVKLLTVQELTRAGLRRLAPDLITLARAEGLPAHAASAALRLRPPEAAR